MARSVLLVRTNVTLGALDQYFSEVFHFPPTWFDRDSLSVVGFMHSDQAGQLDIWQGSYQADVSGAAAVAGATLVIPNVNAGGGNGVEVSDIISAPWVRFVYTNGAIQQTVFRLELRAVR